MSHTLRLDRRENHVSVISIFIGAASIGQLIIWHAPFSAIAFANWIVASSPLRLSLRLVLPLGRSGILLRPRRNASHARGRGRRCSGLRRGIPAASEPYGRRQLPGHSAAEVIQHSPEG